MRIKHLHLLAYGPFTERDLIFETNDQDFNLVYGPNEAGKSCALRAIKAALYSFPERTSDDFRHEKKNLKVGMSIEAPGCETLNFIRRKGKKNTLLNSEGQNMPEETLSQIIKDVSKETFNALFGIDHNELRRGGNDILEGKGELGKILFGAGAGIVGVKDILKRLADEADSLFKKGGSLPDINSLLSKLKDVRSEIKVKSLKSSDYINQKDSLQNHSTTKDGLSKEINEIEIQISKLKRLKDVMPKLAQRNDYIAERQELGDVELLKDTAGEERRKAETDYSNAENDIAEIKEQIKILKGEINSIEIQRELLKSEERIRSINEEINRYRDAKRDLPERSTEVRLLDADAAEITDRLRRASEVEDIEIPKLTDYEVGIIEELADKYNDLTKDAESAETAQAELKSDVEELTQKLAEIVPPGDSAKLKAELGNSVKELGQEEQLLELTADAKGLKEQIDIDVKKLGLFSGNSDQLETLKIPSLETIKTFESDLTKLRSSEEHHQGLIDSKSREIESLNNELDEHISHREVPLLDDLNKSREIRDGHWESIKGIWIEGKEVSDYESESDLADVYEEDVRTSDSIGDELRKESEFVAKREHLLTTQDGYREDIKILERTLKDSKKNISDKEEEWISAWQELDDEPESPSEMRDWREQYQAIINNLTDLRRQKSKIEAFRESIISRSQSVSMRLVDLGYEPWSEGESLSDIVNRCQIIINKTDERMGEIKNYENRRVDKNNELTKAKRRHQENNEDLDEVKGKWAGSIKALGLKADTSPIVALKVLKSTQDFFQKKKEIAALEERINLINEAISSFETNVTTLSDELVYDRKDMQYDQIASHLSNLFSKAKEDETKLLNLEENLNRELNLLSKAEKRKNGAELQLKQLCREARVSDPKELPQKEKLTEKANNLDREISDLGSRIMELGGGSSLETLIEETSAIDFDALGPAIETNQDEREEKKADRDDIIKKISLEEDYLTRTDGEDLVAVNAKQEEQSLIAEIRVKSERFLKLKLARILLDKSIEAYRLKNQSPILEKASDYFKKLTLGKFERLVAGYDDKDKPIILGIRDSEENVEVEGLSDGSCDQLYLAIRLASLEHHLNNYSSMPLIVDDILINFDNDRAQATFEILLEFSKRTQVIFFTHHKHLVDVAKDAAHGRRLNIIELN